MNLVNEGKEKGLNINCKNSEIVQQERKGIRVGGVYQFLQKDEPINSN